MASKPLGWRYMKMNCRHPFYLRSFLFEMPTSKIGRWQLKCSHWSGDSTLLYFFNLVASYKYFHCRVIVEGTVRLARDRSRASTKLYAHLYAVECRFVSGSMITHACRKWFQVLLSWWKVRQLHASSILQYGESWLVSFPPAVYYHQNMCHGYELKHCKKIVWSSLRKVGSITDNRDKAHLYPLEMLKISEGPWLKSVRKRAREENIIEQNVTYVYKILRANSKKLDTIRNANIPRNLSQIDPAARKACMVEKE